VDCILICILCKFDEYICYSSRDIKFFLGVTFYRALYTCTCREKIGKVGLRVWHKYN